MSFSNELTEKIEILLRSDYNINEIDKKAKIISEKYRANDNSGKRLVIENIEAVAYALARMPATYEAVSNVIEKLYEYNDNYIDSVLDVGAGTGAATWAMYNKHHYKSFTCYEREQEMIAIGKKIMSDSELSNITNWVEFDAIKDEIDKHYDLVITSYMINELPKEQVENVILKLWNATENFLVIIEPGTPRGFSNVINIREKLLKRGAHIVAPCPHEEKCQLPEDDWCQFACRVQRSKIHKKLKEGSSPFEDEKFSYLILSKNQIKKGNNRILRHPIINKGYTQYKVCSKSGIKEIKLSKKDGIIYKESKKKSAGDCLDIE